MSKRTLKVYTTQADRVGESQPPPVPRKDTVWEFQRVDILPSRDNGNTVWHTYILVEAASPPVAVRAFIRYTPDPSFPNPRMQALNGKDVAILSVQGGRATCLPMDGGPILNVDFVSLEVRPGTDAEAVMALYR